MELLNLLTAAGSSNGTNGIILFASILSLSAFVRISLVISFIAIGLGLRNAISTIWVLLLSLSLTMLVMSPLIKESNELLASSASGVSAEQKSSKVLTLWKDTAANKINAETKIKFHTAAKEKNPKLEIDSWEVIAPLYVIEETKIAFRAGLKILLPFLVIDLLVAHIFTALGIVTMSASTLSFVLKLLAINYTGGLDLIISSLLSSFK